MINGKSRFLFLLQENIMRRLSLILVIVIAGCNQYGSDKSSVREEPTKTPPASGIVYRNPRVYNVDYSFELRPRLNEIDRAKDLKLWIPIPREWESQKDVKIISVQPEPHAKYADPEFGNLMLYWDFGKEPEQTSYKVEIEYRLESYEIYADIDPNKIGPYDKTSDDYALYTRSTHTVIISPKVRELAQAAIGDEENPYLQARRIYDFIQKKERFRCTGVGVQALLDSLVKDEKTGEEYYEGVCYQYSAFFVALCRAVGIPARSVTAFIGWRPWPWIEEEDAKPWHQGNRTYKALGLHLWAEIFLPNYGWIPVDPTYGSFGQIDNKYIIMSKNRDIKIGPYPPQSEDEGYSVINDPLYSDRANMLYHGVWNRSKYSTNYHILHHSDPFPADALAEYMTMLSAETEVEKKIGLYRKRTLRWIDQNTREHTDKVTALARAYEKERRTSYQHQAFICHMLRKLVGDEKFSEIVETYTDLRVKSGEPVSMDRFQEIAEKVYGQSLDWFFKQWVGYTELPQLQLDAVTFSEDEKGWHVRGTLSQLNKSLFHLPVGLAIETETATEHKTLLLEERKTDFEFGTTNRPTNILVDPNNDILRIMEMPPLLENPSYDEVASFAVPYLHQRAGNKGKRTPLYFVAETDQTDIVAFLISKGDDVNVKDLLGFTPLHIAAMMNRKEVVELLIDKGADVNAKDNEGRTPLSWANQEGHDEIVKFLIAKGADVSLHFAAGLGDITIVKSLIEDGADVNAKDERGQTPLHVAVARGHVEVAELLINKGANVNAKRGKYPTLSWAVWNEDRDMIKLLVIKGAEVNFAEDDWPYLHYLAWNNDRELVERLLDHGAKLNVKDEKGRTELHIALSRGHRDLVEFLVSKGATAPEFHLAVCQGNLERVKSFVEEGNDVNTKDELGWSPLYWAASMGREEVAEFLIGKGADIDVEISNNRTLLHQAARSGAAKLVELLISKGADSNARDKNDSTPLHSAAGVGHKNIVKFLITKGADVKATEKSGNTPLHHAAGAGDRAIVELLIAKGVDVSAAANKGTPLHRAAANGHSNIVQILLAKGADTNARDNKDRTALGLAKEKGHTEVVELLRKHGAK